MGSGRFTLRQCRRFVFLHLSYNKSKYPKEQMAAPTYQIPALGELIRELERAFRHHLEVDTRGSRTLLLRIAGREFLLAGVHESAETLMHDLCTDLAEVAAFGFATAMTDESFAGTRLRMDLITALASLEATKEHSRDRQDDRFLTTAEVAAQLGMSRPYVSMLCNQGKLGEVGRSEGGHRRIQQSAVDAYRKAHLTSIPALDTAQNHEEHKVAP
jgi:excisionase family DNA binding protein